MVFPWGVGVLAFVDINWSELLARTNNLPGQGRGGAGRKRIHAAALSAQRCGTVHRVTRASAISGDGRTRTRTHPHEVDYESTSEAGLV